MTRCCCFLIGHVKRGLAQPLIDTSWRETVAIKPECCDSCELGLDPCTCASPECCPCACCCNKLLFCFVGFVDRNAYFSTCTAIAEVVCWSQKFTTCCFTRGFD
jgi:hypothetical protein